MINWLNVFRILLDICRDNRFESQIGFSGVNAPVEIEMKSRFHKLFFAGSKDIVWGFLPMK
jgi:hypothetical protein